MKKLLSFVFMLSLAAGAAAQEFNPVPRAWKWISPKEVIFTYDGTYADEAAFVVDARSGKTRGGVSAPEKNISCRG